VEKKLSRFNDSPSCNSWTNVKHAKIHFRQMPNTEKYTALNGFLWINQATWWCPVLTQRSHSQEHPQESHIAAPPWVPPNLTFVIIESVVGNSNEKLSNKNTLDTIAIQILVAPRMSAIHSSIHPFIHVSIHPFIRSSIHPFIHSSMHRFIHSSVHPFIRSPIHPFIHSSIHPFIHSSIHPFIHSPIHPFIHSSIHPFIHSSIHPFIHSSIHPFIRVQSPIPPFIHSPIHPCTIHFSISLCVGNTFLPTLSRIIAGGLLFRWFEEKSDVLWTLVNFLLVTADTPTP